MSPPTRRAGKELGCHLLLSSVTQAETEAREVRDFPGSQWGIPCAFVFDLLRHLLVWKGGFMLNVGLLSKSPRNGPSRAAS